jgi:hypothetical protein
MLDKEFDMGAYWFHEVAGSLPVANRCPWMAIGSADIESTSLNAKLVKTQGHHRPVRVAQTGGL